jgi:hypothetical protein
MKSRLFVCLTALFAVTCSAAFAAPAAKDAKKPAPAKAAKAKAAKAKAAKPKAPPPPEVTYPPKLPDGKTVVTDTSDAFLKPADTLRDGVSIAKTPPTIDFLYYPGQTYAGRPWSNWGDSIAANGKYYASIGDHLAPAGNAYVYEYDPAQKSFRKLAEIAQLIKLPEGDYVPGKIHSRLDLGDDGWLYFATHRGSTKVTADQYNYKGDWILRCNPKTGESEIVTMGAVPKHCVPTSVLDPKRLIFYGGTAPGTDSPLQAIQFFAYDIPSGKVIYSGGDGPARAIAFAKSTGRVYYTAGAKTDAELMRFDPDSKTGPVQIPGVLGMRAATQETPQGIIYTISSGQAQSDAEIFALDTRTEKVTNLGPAAVASQAYVASLDADPTGRYLYYVPGAHGGSEKDGSAVVQFDTKTRKRKVIAFLHPFYQDKYGCALKGTYSTAVSEDGSKLYITWNANRGSRAWDTCALTVLHIPESERQP